MYKQIGGLNMKYTYAFSNEEITIEIYKNSIELKIRIAEIDEEFEKLLTKLHLTMKMRAAEIE